MVLIGAIPHTFDINTNPALVAAKQLMSLSKFFGRGFAQAWYVMREWLSAFEYRIPLSDNKSYLQWLGDV